MHSRSYLFLGLVVFLAALAGFLYTKKPYHMGLDVRGGVRLTYQIDKNSLTKGESLEEAKAKTLKVLEYRASGALGAAEAVVQPKGDDQFIIELPGYSDVDKAKSVIGSSAKILFYDAKNVNTETVNFREYNEVEEAKDSSQPEVLFTKRSGGEQIKPGTPDYKAVIDGWELICGGDELTRANMLPQGEHYLPEMHFSGTGADKMERWSQANNRRGEKLAAVLDGVCISIAKIKDGAVLSNEAVIEGSFTPEYVRNLTDLLNAGALPVNLTSQSTEKVDPSIGRNALDQIVTAGLIAASVIAAFMLVYYVFPGFIAVLALGLYILFTLTALKLIDATFSLAAIAGFVLSVGMAVDANILVFERLKEELRSGKTLAQAIELGFRRALPAIVDSNACTVLTAFVLANIGTGPVKGFATTLIIGVAISLFTAVMVTRSLLVFFVGSGLGDHPKWYGLSRQWFGEGLEKGAQRKPLQIVNKAGRYFLISGLTIVPGVIFWAMGGLKGNVEFTGGTEAVYAITGQSVTSQQIASSLEKHNITGANVTIAESGKDRLAYITVPGSKAFENKSTAESEAEIATDAGLGSAQARGISAIGPAIRAETIQNAFWGVIYSSGLIILYLAIRFGFALGGFKVGFRFSVSTILALVHDILVVIGLAAITGFLLGWQVSALFISAMLTVIGFSTHDTIVIFDRIRENLRKPQAGEDSGNLINRSITQSIARSINTSMTVIVTLAILIGVGSATPDLKLFNAAMLIGIVSGTYSSIFNASPILYLWDKHIGKTNPANTLLGIADANRVRVKLTTTVAEPSRQAQDGAAPGYGQVKRRRASDIERSRQNLDD